MESYYKNLDVWKKAIDFVEQIYVLTTKFPKEEMYGISSQMRRAAVSIASNIAEGSGRSSDADNVRFLYIAKGSAMELETQIIIAEKLGYMSPITLQELQGQVEIILKMLTKLIQYKISSIKL